MKNIITLCFLFIVSISAYSQTGTPAKPQNGSAIQFAETSHDFGDIYQGDKVQHIFTFKNTGNQPLIITEVITTCGCTAPTWSKEPVAPGKTGQIHVAFDSENKMGRQNKGITVLSNAINNPSRVTIITNVLPKKQ